MSRASFKRDFKKQLNKFAGTSLKHLKQHGIEKFLKLPILVNPDW